MTGEILEGEIFEQPDVVKRLITEEWSRVVDVAKEVNGSFDYVVIAARGTSDNAARYAQYLLGAHNQLPVGLATPSLFTLYHQPPKLNRALVLGISQSGQSPDIVAVIEEARKQGRPTIAVTNEPESPLAQNANYLIQLHTGPEHAVAATKTYTASLVALALFSTALRNHSPSFEQLNSLPELMQETLSHSAEAISRVERYRYTNHLAVIARGFNYATAFEVSLKVKELTQIVAEPYSSADFLHGPISMIHEGFPVLMIATRGSVLDDMRALAQRLEKLNSELLLISDDDDLLIEAQFPMRLPSKVPEWLTPVIAVLPGQLFSLGLARAKGLDPDKPEGLSKVTETW
jgi:glucosamine--fructose-6-phosphate aminotransferase (isomerizing)